MCVAGQQWCRFDFFVRAVEGAFVAFTVCIDIIAGEQWCRYIFVRIVEGAYVAFIFIFLFFFMNKLGRHQRVRHTGGYNAGSPNHQRGLFYLGVVVFITYR